jgi:hypothetical protein
MFVMKENPRGPWVRNGIIHAEVNSSANQSTQGREGMLLGGAIMDYSTMQVGLQRCTGNVIKFNKVEK